MIELTRRTLLRSGAALAASIATASLLNTVAEAEALPSETAPYPGDMIDDIIHVMTQRSFITKAEILSADRSRRVVHARQRGMFICREIGTASLPEIGRRFGGWDHTAVLHAERKIRRQMQADPVYAMAISTLVFESIALIERRGHAPEGSLASRYYTWRSKIEGRSLAHIMNRWAAC
jgi:hypothetical protein